MAETLERFERTFTSLLRTDDALQSGLSGGVPCRTFLLAIHHCWRRYWDVCNPLKPHLRL